MYTIGIILEPPVRYAFDVNTHCADCGRLKNEGPESAPCVKCGCPRSVRYLRTIALTQGTARLVKWGPIFRPWYRKWRHALQLLALLEEKTGSTATTDRIQARAVAVDFFTTCFHVMDWVLND